MKIQWRISICLSGVYPRTEEQNRKIGESRKRYFDEHGRVVEINQKESPEAYREYQRLYQQIYRKRHKHYYRDLKRKQKEVQDMQKLEDIVSKFNEIQVNCLEVKYGTSAFNEDKMKTLVGDLNKMMNDCIEELKNESEETNESNNP